MKPAWDKLMKNWNKGDRMKHSVIADVDCTGTGKPLCEENGVKGFPTIKWGDVTALEDYSGPRDYDGLKKFAKENLKPMCSVANVDLCDEEKKKLIAELQAMDTEKLEEEIAKGDADIKAAEETFESEVKKLQEHYTQLQTEKDDTIKEVKASGLSLMKAVAAAAKKKSPESKEEL
mmetsp:Transcript_35209/g.62226  ORF Transcript_35209/g.62226 Transcript_35209/m.62226 type:complete len:176 (+) Transcript_35209:229-756(+)